MRMKISQSKAPFWRSTDSVALLMRRVLIALIPVILTSSWFFGVGILLNLVFACAVCVALEAIILAVRKRPVAQFTYDGSALITGALIALAIPPLTPWWITATACLFAIAFAKHLYGGLGYNVFNPAMVGYVAILVSFPQALSDWPLAAATPSLSATLDTFLFGIAPASLLPDAYTGATPLDAIKMQLQQMRTMDEIMAMPMFGKLAGQGWGLINLAALSGGLWLLSRQVIRWHIPVAMLGTMAVCYLGFYAFEPNTQPSPLIGLLSGGTMLGAFFIATDPVSAATSDRGRLIYGAGIGALCFCLRKWGAYPDAIAFAVLLMNMAAPLIDRYTLPRIYGHRR
jgi:electron transport complex protein RnfD